MVLSSSDELLVARLRALPEPERAPAIERACADDPSLRARWPVIRAALEAAEAAPAAAMAGHLAPGSGVMLLNSALELASGEQPGMRIGPYKLLQEIGRGGFGVVWMADQEKPIRRRVALKIIKAGMDTREVIVRFEAERQALALMDHANIARVFDAGATDAGRPYFAMELVRGVAITRYCDDNRLPAEARLQLFVVVCQAVQHAHTKGVIHRDLKPSNILVTLHDGVPVPKIIDFGIAKATGGARLTEKTLFTQFHAFIGTPAYTSPEQMEMSGLDVDTRSDIYSLGVLLYELLTGRPPFDGDALVKSGLDGMRRTIREIDPPRPSNRLTTLTDAERSSVAQHRSTDAAKLSLLLRGDLDWIVMRCLEKDRAHRYETANGLAQDIQRHLASEPVAARPPSGVYRLRKFIRRHQLGVAASIAIAGSVLAGLVAASVLLVRERAARTRAVEAEMAEGRLRQQAEAARALEAKQSSRTALNLADQLLAKGQTADALAYLVQSARKDPTNTRIAPRLVSLLTSRNFLIPAGAPLAMNRSVVALRYSQDGRWLYVGTEDGTYRVFDADTGEQRLVAPLGNGVVRFGWVFAEENPEIFAVRFTDRTLGVYDAGTGRPLWRPFKVDDRFPARVATGAGLRLEFSPHGRWLCVHTGNLGFCILDAATGEIQAEQHFGKFYYGPVFTNDESLLTFITGDTVHSCSLPGFRTAFEPIAIKNKILPDISLIPFYSPDGKLLSVVDEWGDIHVFTAHDGTPVRTVPNGNGLRRSQLPDGRLLAVQPKSWEIFDPCSGQSASVPAADGFSGSRCVAAGGKLVLTASDDGFARIWEVATGRLLAEPTWHSGGGFQAALSSDGLRVALGTADGTIARFRVGRGAARPLNLPRSHYPTAQSAPYVPGRPASVLWFGADQARVLDVPSGREIAGGFAYPGADLPLLRRQATWFRTREDLRFIVVQDWTGQEPMQVWEYGPTGIHRGVPLLGDRGSPVGRSAVAFSPRNDLVARAVSFSAISVWNLRDGSKAGPDLSYRGANLNYISLDFSPDGTKLAAPLEGGGAVVWEVATGRVAGVFDDGGESGGGSVAFNADGTRLLTINRRGEPRLWNVTTGRPCSRPLSGGDGRFDLSANGQWYLSTTATGVRICDGRTGSVIGEFPTMVTHGETRFSPDGRLVAGPDDDGNLRVRDVRTGESVSEGQHPAEPFWQVRWSPDGRFVENVTPYLIQIWAVPPMPEQNEPAPAWLLQMASLLATRVIDDDEKCVDAPELIAQIGDLRRKLAELPDDAPYVKWGRWIIDESPDRPIAPEFSLTPAEADKLGNGPSPSTRESP